MPWRAPAQGLCHPLTLLLACLLSPVRLAPSAPQVAAHASHHICVRKATAEGAEGSGPRLVTRFDTLVEPGARRAEIAAMLGLTEAAAEDLMRAAEALPR